MDLNHKNVVKLTETVSSSTLDKGLSHIYRKYVEVPGTCYDGEID